MTVMTVETKIKSTYGLEADSEAKRKTIDTLTAASGQAQGLLGDPRFAGYLVDHGIDTDWEDPAPYWRAFAAFASAEHPKSSLEDDSLRLVAMLPDAVIQSYYLKNYSDELTFSSKSTAKRTLSNYNKLVKDFVTTHPVAYSELLDELNYSVADTIGAESTELLRHSNEAIENILKGMRHEIGFAEVLQHAGIGFRESTIEEDLRGVDLVVAGTLEVDVKASLSEVDYRNKGHSGLPVAVDSSTGKITLYSCIDEKHFKDGFHPDEDFVKEMSPQIIDATLGAVLK